MGKGRGGNKGDGAYNLGEEGRTLGNQLSNELRDVNERNYAAYNPLATRLSGQVNDTFDSLNYYSQNVNGANGQIMKTAQELKGLGNQGIAAGEDIYGTGLAYGGGAARAGTGVYDQGLQYANGAMDSTNAFLDRLTGMGGGSMSQPNISLGSVQNGSVQNGSTAAGGYGADYFNEWKNTYAPAARQMISDAQNFNTANYRENLATQAASDAAMQFQNAQAQNMRSMASMGVNPNSGAALGMQNQAMLANAAQRAGASTNTRWMAEQEGWKRVQDAVNNQAGSHLMGASNDALGVEASVTNANTGAQASVANANTAAQASVANANTAAQASMANQWLDSQTSLGTARMDAAASAFNAGLDAQSKNFQTGSAGLFSGINARNDAYNVAAQARMQGIGQGLTGYTNAGGLQHNAGQLKIDSARAANELAGGSLGLVMTPGEQYFQNLQAVQQPRLWGQDAITNGYNTRANIRAGAAANGAAQTSAGIGAVGSIAAAATPAVISLI